jgi:glutathionyl-hydroquinone reductase
MTIVCSVWLQLQKLNYNAENGKYKMEVMLACPTDRRENISCSGK